MGIDCLPACLPRSHSCFSRVHTRADETEGICNYVNEIPLHSRAKMEIATEEADNPIKQDIKKVNAI